MGKDTDEKRDLRVVEGVVVGEDIAARLRADLKKAQPFPSGTVVRFTSVATNGQHFHYSAIFTAGQWWFTGQGNGFFPKAASHQEFTALMVSRGHTIIDLEVATGFEKIEL